MEGTRKEILKQDIINEHKMRSSNNKEAMLDLLEEHITKFFGLPEGIAKLERDEEQMSYNIFDNYICFDYHGERIEVRYKNSDSEEKIVGYLIFGTVRPLWTNDGKETRDFNLSILDQVIDNAFKIK
ncbi:hypothetical protein FQ087_06125 [Sporosarcina sp. ANT_H38]|uniref:hypothetical protein n=1 Tax=Sporosarcina sp. ANT_H38 TaxID=2597358 RepID=UPI0011F3C5A2|nr:hypothetical protein [Sporosarcina sp. ANT_H38]KAA0965841.1 hypothetical protein FQ087_06125 [Sporosarcina sp. ANT_H38]